MQIIASNRIIRRWISHTAVDLSAGGHAEQYGDIIKEKCPRI